MGDHCLSKLVVATLVGLDDDEHQLGHVVLLGASLHIEDVLHAPLQLLRDQLARMSVDQDDPFVDKELLGLELNLDGFEHLNRLNDDWE